MTAVAGLRRGPRPAGCGGNVNVVFLACVIVLCTLCLFMADIGILLSAKNQAQNAADAAALAAVQESFLLFATGVNPRRAAGKFAESNGARLRSMEISRSGDRVKVEVSVDPDYLLVESLGIGRVVVRAKAAAEIDMEALLASSEIWFTPDPKASAQLKNVLESGGPRDRGSSSTMVALLALQHLGKPYRWGASGPNSFDCSGLVCYVYSQIGVWLPRTTFGQVLVGKPVSSAELAPGDLVFFRGNAHVGIYMGNGWYIHAPHTGAVVRIARLSDRAPSTCRRII